MTHQYTESQEAVQGDESLDKGAKDITDVIKRAVMDPAFKELLLNDPDRALKEYALSEVQVLMVKNMRREDLEKLSAENLEEFFSSDAAVYTPHEIDVGEFEAYSIEDFGAEFEAYSIEDLGAEFEPEFEPDFEPDS